MINKVNELDKILYYIHREQVVCFPTDTILALAANAYSTHAVKKIYQIKNRPYNKPLAIFVKNKSAIYSIAEVNPKSEKIIEKYMPGAITVILKLKKNTKLSPKFFPGTVGIRIPTNNLARAILNSLHYPLVATSVNLTNQPSVTRSSEIPNIISGQLGYCVKYESLKKSEASTIIDLTDHNNPRIVRQGEILIDPSKLL